MRLDLSHNGIGNRGACTLAGGLRFNHTLKHLQLNGNPLGVLGGRALMLTWNYAVKPRFISLQACHFDVSDFTPDALDLSACGGEYDLNFDDMIKVRIMAKCLT